MLSRTLLAALPAFALLAASCVGSSPRTVVSKAMTPEGAVISYLGPGGVERWEHQIRAVSPMEMHPEDRPAYECWQSARRGAPLPACAR